MSIVGRSLPYPLDALFKQETWRLETLQSELADISRRLSKALDHRDALQGAIRALATSMHPIPSEVIDPDRATRRLFHLRALQQRAGEAAWAAVALEQARDRLRASGLKQHAKVDSIERHRQDYFRDEAARDSRQQSAEVDREWLARMNWRLLRRVVPAQAMVADAGHSNDIA